MYTYIHTYIHIAGEAAAVGGEAVKPRAQHAHARRYPANAVLKYLTPGTIISNFGTTISTQTWRFYERRGREHSRRLGKGSERRASRAV
jgi:hypothetical protein